MPKLMTVLEGNLIEADISPDKLKALPKEKRNEILKMRWNIIRALCGKVKVYASGQVVIGGMLDGSEAAQFELENCSIAMLCYNAPYKSETDWRLEIASQEYVDQTVGTIRDH